jgi:hypothetical protein
MFFKDSEKEVEKLEQIIFKMKNDKEDGYNYWNKYYNKNFILNVKMVSEEKHIYWNCIELNRKIPPISSELYSVDIPSEFHIEILIRESCFFSWMGDLIVNNVRTTTNEGV